MKKLALLAVAALVGCASPQQLRQTVGNASNFQLCRAIFLAPRDVAQIATEEAQRRSLDCAPYASAVFQNEAQADAARSALAQQLLMQSHPQTPFVPLQIPQPINCQSYRMGNTIQSTCH